MEWRGPYSQPAALDSPKEKPMDIPMTITPARDSPTCTKTEDRKMKRQVKKWKINIYLKVWVIILL